MIFFVVYTPLVVTKQIFNYTGTDTRVQHVGLLAIRDFASIVCLFYHDSQCFPIVFLRVVIIQAGYLVFDNCMFCVF